MQAPEEIRLKLKYRSAPTGRAGYSPSSDNRGKKKTHFPLTDRERALHAAQPKKVRHVLANGKHRMEIADK